MGGLLKEIASNIILGRVAGISEFTPERKGEPGVVELTQKAVEEGVGVEHILNKGLLAGMDIIKPLMIKSGIEPKNKALIGTVKGDLHDIGKDIV
jgi:methanogenic corrinoid protein MtbC1